MLPIATGVIDQMRSLEHDVHQKPEPAEPQSEVTPTPTPTGEVVSTASLKVVSSGRRAPNCQATRMLAASS